MLDKKEIINIIKDNGYRYTNQRKAILNVLIDNKNHLISAEEIYKLTKKLYPKTNFSTVYRNLEMFEKIGVVHSTNTDSNKSVFELICNNSHHHHIICKSCGKTKAIDFCPFLNIKNKLSDDDFTLTDHKFELYGYCKKCKNKEE